MQDNDPNYADISGRGKVIKNGPNPTYSKKNHSTYIEYYLYPFMPSIRRKMHKYNIVECMYTAIMTASNTNSDTRPIG